MGVAGPAEHATAASEKVRKSAETAESHHSGQSGEGEKSLPIQNLDDDDLGLYDVNEIGVPEVPDGGYGWVIVFSSFMCNFIVDGIANSFSIFLARIALDLHVEKGSAAWANSILCGTYLLVGPIVSAMTNMYGCKIVVIAGAIIASAGFFLSALSRSLGVLILTYGIIGGIGFGCIYLPSIVCVGYYFESKRALATGIAVCGSGAGQIVFALIGNLLLEYLTWKEVHLIYGGIILLCIGLAILMKPLQIIVTVNPDDDEEEDVEVHTVADAKRVFHERGSLAGSGFFIVNLPDGTQERRQKKSGGIISTVDLDKGGKSDPASSVVDEPKEMSHGGRGHKSEDGGKSIGTANSSHGSGMHKMQRRHSFKAVPVGTTHSKSSKQNVHDRKNSHKNSILSSTSRTSSKHTQNSNHEIEISDGVVFNSSDNEDEIRHIIRPMSRKDIFYSGSIANLPEFQNHDITTYRQSIVNLPRPPSRTNAQGDSGSEHDIMVPVDRKRCESIRNICSGSRGRAFKSALKEMTDFSLLKNPVFLFICASNVFGFLAFFVPLVFIGDAAKENVHAIEKQAAILISVMGITNTIGRIICGLIADCKQVDVLLLNNMCLLLPGILIAFIPMCDTYVAYVVVIGLFAFILAGFISLTSIVLVKQLGLEHLTTAFGIVTLFRGCAAIIGSPIAGFLYASFENYDIPFWIAGGFFVTSALMGFLIPDVARFAPTKHVLEPNEPPVYQVNYLQDEVPDPESPNKNANEPAAKIDPKKVTK